jgi:hypothetical protein
VTVLAIVGMAKGLTSFTAYPLTEVATSPSDLGFAAALAIAASLPVALPRRQTR